MLSNLFEDFLNDPAQYEASERYWLDLWNEVVASTGMVDGWKTIWLGTGSPSIKDGNPIFSAVSPALKRGILVVQQEPLDPGLDFQYWLDTFGGPPEAEAVDELVISCVLSVEAARLARSAMIDWVSGHTPREWAGQPAIPAVEPQQVSGDTGRGR